MVISSPTCSSQGFMRKGRFLMNFFDSKQHSVEYINARPRH